MKYSKRCANAINALKSNSMPLVLDVIIRANAADNAKYEKQPIVLNDDVSFLKEEHDESWPNRAMLMLDALDDAFVDALYVVMYVGRDEADGSYPYDELEIERQFVEWWNFLGVDGEHFAREQMGEKWPLGRYLLRGSRLFRVYAP